MEIARWAKIPKKKGRDQSTQKNHENLWDLRNLHRDSREPSENQRDSRSRRGSEVLRTSERSKRLRKDREPLVRKNHRENWEIDSQWRRKEIKKWEPLAARGDPKGIERPLRAVGRDQEQSMSGGGEVKRKGGGGYTTEQREREEKNGKCRYFESCEKNK